MYAQVEKPKENKNRVVVNSVTQKKENIKQDFGFVDNGPETTAQRKLQGIMDNSLQAIEYKTFHNGPKNNRFIRNQQAFLLVKSNLASIRQKEEQGETKGKAYKESLQGNIQSANIKSHSSQQSSDGITSISEAVKPYSSKFSTFNNPNNQFRLPNYAALNALYTSGTVNQDVIRNRVRTEILRMQQENKLRTVGMNYNTTDIMTIMNLLFPAQDTIDQNVFDAIVNTADRSRV